ncbi:hypothetical protein D2Q93_15415 [Alicyclobacillaceae bacterium I2511]|nr:hypothetical protein D2Q93_15415 [Alicyclobacillaceae bacterium I2511]
MPVQNHCLIMEQSRKAKAVRNLYEYLRQKAKKREGLLSYQWETFAGQEGLRVTIQDRFKALNLRVHDEYMSPYFKTDMNLFQLHMLDDTVDVAVYKTDSGWLLVYDGVPIGPKPFGQAGYDTR